jgi:hypothetical protein
MHVVTQMAVHATIYCIHLIVFGNCVGVWLGCGNHAHTAIHCVIHIGKMSRTHASQQGGAIGWSLFGGEY